MRYCGKRGILAAIEQNTHLLPDRRAMPAGPFLFLMKKLSVLLDDNQHLEIQTKATVLGLPLTEIVRRLLIGWMRGDIELPGGDR